MYFLRVSELVYTNCMLFGQNYVKFLKIYKRHGKLFVIKLTINYLFMNSELSLHFSAAFSLLLNACNSKKLPALDINFFMLPF